MTPTAHFSLLPVIIGLPFLGAFCVSLIYGAENVVARNAKNVGLLVSGVALALALFVMFKFDFAAGGLQFEYEKTGIKSLLLSWKLGVNALSAVFVLLTAFFAFAAVLITPRALPNVKVFMIMTLIIEGFLLGAVCSRNLFQFFLFHEGTFIPLFMLGAVWGEKNGGDGVPFSRYGYFFLSTILFFFGILYLHAQTESLDLDALARQEFSPDVQAVLLAVFLPSFMINAPFAPFHQWFVKAQSDTPPPCLLILSGALSKVALYGTLAVVVPLSAGAMASYAPLLMTWAVLSALFACASLLTVRNLKEKIVYAQMCLCALTVCAVFSLRMQAVFAVLLFCLAQSAVFAVFIVVLTFLFDRLQSADVSRVRGLGAEIPAFAAVFFVAGACFAVLPATPVFMPVFLLIENIFTVHYAFGVAALAGVTGLFTAMANLYAGIISGERERTFFPYADLNRREKTLSGVMFAVLFCLAAYPDVLTLPCSAGARVLSAFLTAAGEG